MRGSLDALLDVSRLDVETVAPRETNFALSTLLDWLAIEFGPQANDKAFALKAVGTLTVVSAYPPCSTSPSVTPSPTPSAAPARARFC